MQRFEQRPISRGHLHLEDEPQLRRTVGKGLTRGRDDEGALTGDEASEREADEVPGPQQSWKKLGGADGTRIHDLLYAIQALYQLSYSPRAIQSTSGLETLTHRTHVLKVPMGYDIYP